MTAQTVSLENTNTATAFVVTLYTAAILKLAAAAGFTPRFSHFHRGAVVVYLISPRTDGPWGMLRIGQVTGRISKGEMLIGGRQVVLRNARAVSRAIAALIPPKRRKPRAA